MTKRNHIRNNLINAVGVILLIFNCRSIIALVNRQIRLIACGEAQIFAAAPLHWSTRTRSAETAFFTYEIALVSHSYFIAVVKERYARHCKDKCVNKLYSLLIKIRGNTRHIVVVGHKADIAVVL